MNKQDKELLLRDLCARLPYGVRGERIWTAPVSGSPEKGIYVFDTFDINVLTTGYYDCGEYGFREVRNYSFKPYLFPLSSMTEEQKKELDKKFHVIGIYWNNIKICYHSEGYWDTDLEVDFQDWLWLINWLNKNHFDYHGLIEKGLAIDASGLNIY